MRYEVASLTGAVHDNAILVVDDVPCKFAGELQSVVTVIGAGVESPDALTAYNRYR